MQPARRPVAVDIVIVVTVTATLWGALFPALVVSGGFDVPALVFSNVALTLGMWGWLVVSLILRSQRTPQATRSAEAERTFASLAHLERRLASGDLPDPVAHDARRAVQELRAEAELFSEIVALCDRHQPREGRLEVLTTRRAEAVHRLADIGAAADGFLHQLDTAPAEARQQDAVERLQAARRAFAASSRELG